MRKIKNIEQVIFELQAKIEHAENMSSGSIEDESRIDDLQCELLELEEAMGKYNSISQVIKPVCR